MKKPAIIHLLFVILMTLLIFLFGCQAVHAPSVSYHEAMQQNLPKATKAEKTALKIFMVSLAVIILTSIK